MAEAAVNGYGKADAPAKPAAALGPYAAGLEGEKRQLMTKLYQAQQSGIEAKAKWWSFCKVHAEGNTDAKAHDVAFLSTFFEAFEAGDIEIEEGCPFQPKGKGCGKDAGKGFGKDGGKGFGKDMGKGFDKGFGGKSFGKDGGKGFGKDKGKGFGKDKGGGKGGKGGGGGAPDDCKIFVGGIPKGTTEEELSAHFSHYGPVNQCMMKYDDFGGFRGFAFMVFASPESASAALADAANQMFKGKWIDCKTATSSSGGGGGKGGKDKGKGDKGKGFGKDGGKGFGKDKGKGFDKGGKDKGKGFGKDKGKGKDWGKGW